MTKQTEIQVITILRAMSKLRAELLANDSKVTYDYFERYINLTDILTSELYREYGERETDLVTGSGDTP